jgi:hypothetical protein
LSIKHAQSVPFTDTALLDITASSSLSMQSKDFCYESEYSNNACITHGIEEYITPSFLFPSQYVKKEKDIRCEGGEGRGDFRK